MWLLACLGVAFAQEMTPEADKAYQAYLFEKQEADNVYKDALNKAKEKCVKVLKKEQDALLVKKDLAGANKIQAKIDDLIENKEKKVEKKPIPIEAKDLIGEWDVKCKDFVAVWKFCDDFSVTASVGTPLGIWSVKDKTVRIEWTAQAWETLYLPLKLDGTKGDSWRGKGCVLAKKKVEKRLNPSIYFRNYPTAFI